MSKHLRSNGKTKLSKEELEALHPVAAWRMKNGVSQAKLAADVGLTQAMISAIEVGKRKVNKDVAAKLRGITKVPAKRILAANEAAGTWLE